MKKWTRALSSLSISAVIAGCGAPDAGQPTAADTEALHRASTGALYAMTNQVGDNQIAVYRRGADGKLTPAGKVSTGGGGSGAQLDAVDPLGSQGSLLLSHNRRFLFALNTNTANDHAEHDCNQGSISVFRVGAGGALTLVGTPVPSGGLFPTSLAFDGHRLFVLNAGGPDTCSATSFEVNPNLTAFNVAWDGSLHHVAGSTRLINPGVGDQANTCVPAAFGPGSGCGLNPPHAARGPAQIALSPWGDSIVVPVKGTDSIWVWPLDFWTGLPVAEPAVWRTPGNNKPFYFGVAFDRWGHLLVTEPLGTAVDVPAPGASALSSFDINWDGSLSPISLDVASGQTEACWIALEPGSQRHAYVTNTHGNSISTYALALDGSLTYLPAAEQHLADGALPNEIVTAGRYVYSLNSGTGKIGMFAIQTDGTLAPLGEADGLPVNDGAEGMAAY